MIKIVLVFLLLIPYCLFAQENDLEIGGNVGIGASQIHLQSDEFNSLFDLSYNAEVFLNYFFSKHIGASLGGSFNQINATLAASNYRSIQESGTDPMGAYHYLLYSDNYYETLKINLFEVPVALVFRGKLSPKIDLRAGLGLKFGIPLSSTYRLDNGISRRLYYPQIMKDESEAIFDIPEWQLYENKKDWNNASGNLEASLNIAAFAHLGLSYEIQRKTSLFTSFYFAYGLNDNIVGSATQLLASNDAGDYNYTTPTHFNENNSIEIGVKVGVLFKISELHIGKRVIYVRNSSVSTFYNRPSDNIVEDSKISEVVLENQEIDTILLVEIVPEGLNTETNDEALTLHD
ncbi:MAG: outer membrane beta-barrel protein, partial [Bacteroidales bacterium]|nr:outer membrane beta-barrel protein [Bacteroidales bacterium]